MEPVSERTNETSSKYDQSFKSRSSFSGSDSGTNGTYRGPNRSSRTNASNFRNSLRLDAIVEEKIDFSNTYNANSETFEVFEYSAPESHNAKEDYFLR